MPVLSPTFVPAQAPDIGEEISLQSQNDAQNWMTQAANRQQTQASTADIQAQTSQREQQNAQQAQLFAMNLPALYAKGQADTLSAQNDAAASTLTQQLRGQWQSLKPQVISDLAAIHDPANLKTEPDGTPDWMDQYNQYESLQAKYSALSLLPEGKQYYDMIDQGKKNAFQMAMSHTAAQMTLDRLKLGSQLHVAGTEATQANAAAVSAQTKPAIAQTEANNTLRNQGFTAISDKRDILNEGNFLITQLSKDLADEQANPGAMVAARFLGTTIPGKFTSSVKQVQSDMGDFANKIMAGVKNIRNQTEFNAVTASIPRADDQAEVQNEKLAKLQILNKILSQRNDYKETVMRSDSSLMPDQADQQATSKYPFPTSIIGQVVKDKPPASMSPEDSQALEWAKANPKDPRSAAILQHIGTLP